MSAYTPGDVVHAIVADVGHYSTKLGFAGEDYPRSYFRSTVAVLREAESMDTSSSETVSSSSKRPRRRPIDQIKYDYFTRPIGYPDNDTDGDWQVSNPVDPTTGLWYDASHHQSNDGADWHDLLQRLLRHGYDSALLTQPEHHPLLLMERSYNPPPIRQQVVECLFEELHVPAAFLGRDATLACYGCGRTTGTVVDVGHAGTVVTPVYDGYVESKGIRRSPMGTHRMDEVILQHLDSLLLASSSSSSSSKTRPPFLPLYQVRKFPKRAAPFHRVARLDVARQAREAGAGATVMATAATNLDSSTTAAFSVPHVAFELPDGETVQVPSASRFAVANLLLGTGEAESVRRDEAVAALKKELSSIVTEASQNEEDKVEEDDEKQEELYSEAAAVGVTQRKHHKAKKAELTKTTKRRPFSNRHLQRACVPYLQSHLEQLTAAAIPDMVCDAAFHCDRDQQAALLGNVILAGGGACLGPTDQAVPDVLREKVEAIIHTHTPGWRVKVLSPGFQERAILSWLGGSILGSLGTFDKMWISRAEYDEWGPAIVNRKCP